MADVDTLTEAQQLALLLVDVVKGISAQDHRDIVASINRRVDDVSNLPNEYGEIIAASNFTKQSVSTSFAKVARFNTNGVSKGVVPDEANDKLTIATDGDYLVGFSGIVDYFLTSGSNIFFFQIFKNDVSVTTQILINRDVSSPSLITNESNSLILKLVKDDVIDLRVSVDDSPGSPEIRFGQHFKLFAIGVG